MITAKDLQEHLTLQQGEKANIVDTWLKEAVFLTFTHDKQGFEIPEELTCGDCKALLSARGFLVDTYSDYQGRFVYISLPPQGE